MGEIEIMFAPSSASVVDAGDAHGDDGTDIDGSGSRGSAGVVSDEWTPMVLKGRRRVPLFGCGSRCRESQMML